MRKNGSFYSFKITKLFFRALFYDRRMGEEISGDELGE
jgi:hypothetical protein